MRFVGGLQKRAKVYVMLRRAPGSKNADGVLEKDCPDDDNRRRKMGND